MKNSGAQAVYSNGIYNGLPVIDDDHKGLSAIVVGASGMSGQTMIDVLIQNPQRWQKVYALSRRSPKLSADTTSNVQHVPFDLLKEPSELAAQMMEHGVKADVVFFFGYVQLSAEERKYSSGKGHADAAEKLAQINGQILQSFLTALDQASITPKRILLQTGLKNYGVQQGPVNVPCDENDPRVELGQANFYYNQEDILFQYCRSHSETSYNVTMPSWILAAVPASDMTTFYPLAVYATVQRKLGRRLDFPGDAAGFEKMMPMSSGILISHFHEWLVLADNTANERFNIVDTSDFSWLKAWPIIAEWFGMEWSPPVEETGSKEYQTVEMPSRPRGYGPKGVCRSNFNLAEWTKKPEVQKAWSELKQEYQLEFDPFASEGPFNSLQFSLTMSWSWATSMDKARKFGWHGHVNTLDSMHAVFEKFVEYKMIPPMTLR